MDRATLYKIWAPDESPWSAWAKPVPFAFWPRGLKSDLPQLRPEITPSLFPPASASCAVIIDLPGGEAVACGILLAKLGYRPVPVFASCPPNEEKQGQYPCAVDAEAVISALVTNSCCLASLALPQTAPPAFLIDAGRYATEVLMTDDYFDNRSAIFASDFPSAETLAGRGVTRVLVVRDGRIAPSADLGYALSHWLKSGLVIDVFDHTGKAARIPWPAMGTLGALFHRLKLAIGLRPNHRGGFGRYVAESSGG